MFGFLWEVLVNAESRLRVRNRIYCVYWGEICCFVLPFREKNW